MFYKVKSILEDYMLVTDLKKILPKEINISKLHKKIFSNIFLDKKKIGEYPRYISIKKMYKPSIAEIDNMSILNEAIYNLIN